MAPALMIAAVGSQLIGGALSASSTLAAGDDAVTTSKIIANQQEYKGQQLDMQAQESRAAAQRAMLDKRRQAGLMLSTLRARVAGGGGDTTDSGTINLAEGITERGEMEALTEMYKGENRARGLEDMAAGARREGDAAIFEGAVKKRAARMKAAGTIVGAVGGAASAGLGGGRFGTNTSAAGYGDYTY
jgi:hypothetical protein